MGDVRKYTDGQSSSQPEGPQVVVPKPEIEDFEMPPETVCSRHIGENVASSSGSNLRSFLIGMGFLTSLVDKVIEEKGEDDADLLVETLIRYSEPDIIDQDIHDKRASLLMMNFSVNEVEFALNKLGADAPFHEIVDFIAAAQIAENFENETEEEPDSWQEKIEESTNEALFGTMEKLYVCLKWVSLSMKFHW
ncbi:probable inactive DNA (cytosine-5)-methyltransferase DRM3 isoform X2 [Carica papaya]|uniref:probable inactive DNA (cytosine-5)-methyltransferase DRM3 isoform X2 n=1 Tax=Carica papaya TaxID=3649 RepID=UPI000B8C9910|nr:probable inactive DNA (cytosine-5)-methyltransferase DRM3 isoform X2 [Carica papaya]